MTSLSRKKSTAAYDIGLLAAGIATIAVALSKAAIAPVIFFPLLFALILAQLLLGLKREALKEGMLDELELAAASFGARWSIAAVAGLAILTAFLPPFQDGISGLSSFVESTDGFPRQPGARTFISGMVVALVVLLIAKSGLAAIWRWTKR